MPTCYWQCMEFFRTALLTYSSLRNVSWGKKTLENGPKQIAIHVFRRFWQFKTITCYRFLIWITTHWQLYCIITINKLHLFCPTLLHFIKIIKPCVPTWPYLRKRRTFFNINLMKETNHLLNTFCFTIETTLDMGILTVIDARECFDPG